MVEVSPEVSLLSQKNSWHRFNVPWHRSSALGLSMRPTYVSVEHRNEMLTWCKEYPSEGMFLFVSYSWSLYIERDEDALMFKLTWE